MLYYDLQACHNLTGPKQSKEVSCMAKCSVCGKGVVYGQNVSHSNRKTNRTWKPNIRKVKAVVDGTHKTVAVCSRCLRSGKVNRA
jgi:large subunit ribosomal protein L28